MKMTFIKTKFNILLLPFCMMLGISTGFAQNYQTFDASTTNAFTAAKWSASSTTNACNASGMTNAFSNTRIAYFCTPNGTGSGAVTIAVGGIIATENYTHSSPSGTLSTGGTVATIDVASGKVFNFGAAGISTTAGTGLKKTGGGAYLASTTTSFTGGFTLEQGTMLLGGVNAMGNGGTLTLNGGSLASTATIKNMAGKFSGGITIGGDVQFGDVSANFSQITAVGNLVFDNDMSIGSTSATRTLTLGSSAVNTFNSIISGSNALTFAANANGTGGTFALAGANTYTGLTTVNGGTVQLNKTGGGTLPSTNNVTVTGGTLQINSDQTLNTLNLNGGTLLINSGVTLTVTTLNCAGSAFTGTGSIVATDVNVTSASDIPQTLTVNGTLTLSAVLSLSGRTLVLAGNTAPIISGGSINASGSIMEFKNTSNYTLPAGLISSTSIGTLKMNGAGGITLGAAITVGSTLNLTSGKITLGGFDLLFTASGTGVSGGSSSSYVITDGTGTLRLPIPASVATTTFPIGTATTYRPASVNFTTAPAAAGTLRGRFVSSSPPTTGLPITEGGSTITNVSPTGYWAMTVGPADGVYTISVDASGFTKTDGTTAISSLTGVRLIKRPNSGSWAATTTTTTTDPGSLGSLSSAGLTGFSEFALGGPAAALVGSLPIELSKFEVKNNQKSAILTWVTASEQDNAVFNIQHSANGVDFNSIGEVKGQGTTATVTTYSYEHSTPSVGVNYYRLKQVDFDGTTTFSPVRSAIFGKSGFEVKNTLVDNNIVIVANDEAVTDLAIFNQIGQQVMTLKAQGEQSFNVNALPSGLYIIRNEKGVSTRFVKQ